MPEWVAPELATLTRDRFSDPAWIFERKLDGERCLAFHGTGRDGDGHGRPALRLMTRNRKPVAGTYPEVLRHLRGALTALERDAAPFTQGALPRGHGIHWVEPRLVAEVAFSEWTTAGQLRHPRFQGLRRDKDPAEVIREVAHDDG